MRQMIFLVYHICIIESVHEPVKWVHSTFYSVALILLLVHDCDTRRIKDCDFPSDYDDAYEYENQDGQQSSHHPAKDLKWATPK